MTVYTFSIGAGSRVSERLITQGATEAAFADKVQSAKVDGNTLARVLHNKYRVTIERFGENYLSYFSPQFLFTSGPREATYGMLPGRGVLLIFALPLLALAGKVFYSQGNYKRAILFLAAWILISPVPASLATGVGFSANRVAAMMPAIDIIIGLGAYAFFELIKGRKSLMAGSIAVMVFVFGMFAVDYFIESPAKVSRAMLYGNLEAAEYIGNNTVSGDVVIVDKSLSEPHIYFAFEGKVDPGVYQNEVKNWKYKEDKIPWVDQMGEYRLGNIVFKDINKGDAKKGAVLVGRPEHFECDTAPVKTIYYPSGEIALEVVRI